MIDNIKSEIQFLRDDIGVEFQRWYDEAKQLASYICTEAEMPRIPRVLCDRLNVPADTPILYYKIIPTKATGPLAIIEDAPICNAGVFKDLTQCGDAKYIIFVLLSFSFRNL